MVTTRSQNIRTSADNRTLNRQQYDKHKAQKVLEEQNKIVLRGVAEDTEQHIHSDNSVVHTISLKAFETKKNGETTLLDELIIFNRSVINHPELENNFDLQKKVTSTKDYVHCQNMKGYKVKSYYAESTYEMIREFVKFTRENGNHLYGHNLLGDLIFLLSTQKFTGGKVAIKNTIKTDQSKGIVIPGWSDIVCIDTLPTLSFFSKKALKTYKDFCLKNQLANIRQMKDYSMKLSEISKCVYNNLSVKQTHIAPDDTTFLLDLIRFIIKCDGPKAVMSSQNRLGKFMPGRPVLSDYIEDVSSSSEL